MDVIIAGLSPKNTEKLVDVILESGEDIYSFEFPQTINRHTQGNKLTIMIMRKGFQNYFFQMIKTEGKISYVVVYRPSDDEEQPSKAVSFDDFDSVLKQFKLWIDVMKGVKGSIEAVKDKIKKLYEPAEPIKRPVLAPIERIILPEPEPQVVNVPKMEIHLSDGEEKEIQLKKLLPFDANTGYLLNRHETQILEYKEIFEWENKVCKVRYIKTLNNFFNRDGGYIVFGISDDGKIKGMAPDEFNKVDNATIYKVINSYFTGNIYVGRLVFKLNDLDLCAFYVGTAPVGIISYCTRDFQDLEKKNVLLKDDVYYRENGGNSKMSAEIMIKKIKDGLLSEMKISNELENDFINPIDDVYSNGRQRDITEEMTRRNDVKPIFIPGNAMYSHDLKLTLLNIGERAKVETVESISDENNVLVVGHTQGYIENKQEVNIFAKPLEQERAKYKFHIAFVYDDKDGRRYRQKFYVDGTTGLKADDAEPVMV